jgi:tetratricopeptide (TPR) repeat protein
MAYAHLSYDPWETPAAERNARLVGREGLLQQLLTAIAEQEGHETLQHYLLLGPRGIGKTTLLLALRDRVRDNPALAARWFCVQLREEEYSVGTLRDLLRLVASGLADEEDLRDAADLVGRVDGETQQARSLAVAVDGLRSLASNHKRRILLLIDNFDRIFPSEATGRGKTRRADSEFRSFRKLLSTEGFLMVIGASVRVFEEIAAYDQSFFNFFSPIEIPNLSDAEICELLRRCAELEGNKAFLAQFAAMRAKVRAITFLTGGNPRLVLMLYDVLRHREMAPVVQSLRETVTSLTPLLKHVLDDMPRQQSKTLDALVRLRGAAPPSEIARMARLPLNVVTTQLGRLKEGRFVAVEGEGKGRPATYRVSDPMFLTWYEMRYLRPAGRRIELFVDFIRAWFSVDERRQFLEEQWGDLGMSIALKFQGYAARETSLMIQYYASALDDESERQAHIGRLADLHVASGRLREAAMLLAESAEPGTLEERNHESAGYRLLGDRMRAQGKCRDAMDAYRVALTKERGNVEATLGLGVCLELAGDHARATSELQRVIDMRGASADQVAMAMLTRGFARGSLGDRERAIADYTAVVGLPGASPEYVAWARINRGVIRGSLGDNQGAIEDYTAMVSLRGIPGEHIALALTSRGAAFWDLGNNEKALSDFQSAANVNGVSSELRSRALLGCGLALLLLHRSAEGVARLDECFALRADAESVFQAFGLLVSLYLREGKLEDAIRTVARLSEFEPADAPIEPRVEVRINTIVTAAKAHGLDVAARFLDTALHSGPQDIRARMEFLAPAIEYARTGDEKLLARLPERERDAAQLIAAAVLTGQEDRVETQALTS